MNVFSCDKDAMLANLHVTAEYVCGINIVIGSSFLMRFLSLRPTNERCGKCITRVLILMKALN